MATVKKVMGEVPADVVVLSTMIHFNNEGVAEDVDEYLADRLECIPGYVVLRHTEDEEKTGEGEGEDDGKTEGYIEDSEGIIGNENLVVGDIHSGVTIYGASEGTQEPPKEDVQETPQEVAPPAETIAPVSPEPPVVPKRPAPKPTTTTKKAVPAK
jgi:hypothetical protein